MNVCEKCKTQPVQQIMPENPIPFRQWNKICKINLLKTDTSEKCYINKQAPNLIGYLSIPDRLCYSCRKFTDPHFISYSVKDVAKPKINSIPTDTSFNAPRIIPFEF